jgi:hypothetical protein
MSESYPRDMVGYGRRPVDPKWPGGARIALQFVMNYEEGGENAILHGDDPSGVLVPQPADHGLRGRHGNGTQP